MFKHSIKYALICGVFLTIIYHLSILLGSNPLIDLSHLIFDLILMGLFIFFMQKEYKSFLNDGFLHFWEGMTLGFLVYTIATVVFAIGLMIYFSIAPNAIDVYKDAAQSFLEERSETYIKQFGEEAYRLQRDEIVEITSWDLVLSASFKKLLAGFFITPVISIILRRRPK